MLDIKLIRDNPQKVKDCLRRRGKDYSAEVDALAELDALRRAKIIETEVRKAEQNSVSKQIPILKKRGEDASDILATMKKLSEKIKSGEAALRELDEKIEAAILFLPNLPHPSVPNGADSSENIEVHRSGQPASYDFTPKPHWEIGEALNILDPARAAKVTGARFHFYRGLGARLERAVMNFFLDSHANKGYTEVFPPFMANRASMTATGQLPKFEEDAFKVADTDYFLIPTAEVPVTNLHRDEILDVIPLRYCAYSACFRAEAGAAGRDARGLIRQHQFNKVELVKFASPENSYDELESLTEDARDVLTALGLPHRTVCLCAGDLGNASAKTYDIEVWMPSYERYVEISSCSNYEDYQARRGSIRFRPAAGGKTRFVHTLNGSGVAIGRTVAAILENFQNADGSVTIPSVLRPYMGVDKITN